MANATTRSHPHACNHHTEQYIHFRQTSALWETPTTHSTTTPTTADSVAEPPTTGSSALPPALPPPVGTLLARCRRHSCRRAASWPPQQPRGAELVYSHRSRHRSRAACRCVHHSNCLYNLCAHKRPRRLLHPAQAGNGTRLWEIVGCKQLSIATSPTRSVPPAANHRSPPKSHRGGVIALKLIAND